MRKLLSLILFFGITSFLFGQPTRKEITGQVIYQTTQNIYAKFSSTAGMNPGDTIYRMKAGFLDPVFVIAYISSISCSGNPIGKTELKSNDQVIAFIPETIEKNKDNHAVTRVVSMSERKDSTLKKENSVEKQKQLINGRFSVLSYQNYSNTTATDFQRMRYTLSFNGKYLGNSKLSVESYVSFSHRLDDWASIQQNVFNGLKIYDLALNYEVSKKTSIWLGRKINPKVSSLGAIDGFQAETGFKNFFAGAIVGFRPDYVDYGFNSNLLEYGGYLGHRFLTRNGSMNTTLAFFQQTNNSNIDRRFTYFQIDNSLVKNLNLFLSGEVDLYSVVNGQPTTSLSLTSFYLSLSYRVNHKLSIYTSYDARKNVIYYETDKSYLDQLLEEATRQGVQLRVSYHPAKLLRFGLSGGYRNRKDDLKPTDNANAFVTINQIPGINTTATLSANYINTSYINGLIYGLRLSKEIVQNKLTADLNFRYVDNKLSPTATSITQYIGEFDLQWNITRKLSFSANYEGTIESSDRYHRVYLSLIQRF